MIANAVFVARLIFLAVAYQSIEAFRVDETVGKIITKIKTAPVDISHLQVAPQILRQGRIKIEVQQD
jgi:Flp pilus assembly secretin CpaC